MAKPRIGGSFAPPLSDEKLAQYRAQIDALPPSPVRDAMHALHKCCAAWWELPESTGTGRPHGSGRGTIIDLDGEIAAKLYDLIPWTHELDATAALFDAIDPADKALRDAAFHLLWVAKELDLDREPLTSDRL